MVERSGDLKALRNESVDLLREFLRNESPTKDDIVRAKAAQVAIGAYSREFASVNARESLRVQLAALTLDSEERAEYIRLAMPRDPLTHIINKRAPAIDAPLPKVRDNETR